MSESSKRLTREEYIEEILVFLYQQETPMQHITAIADGIGVSQATATKYLFYMLPNYLKERIAGNQKQYDLTDEGRKKAEEIIAQREKKDNSNSK